MFAHSLALKRDSRDDIHSAVENKNTHLRYCPLVLQSCTIAAVPAIKYCVHEGVCTVSWRY